LFPFSLLKVGIFKLIFICIFVVSAIVGDITPADGVPKLEKSRREREAIDHMCNLLGGGSRGKFNENF